MILDLFAGPGGWDVAARQLGLDPLGIEWDDSACATREAAGLRTHRADVAHLAPRPFASLELHGGWGRGSDRVDGLIASPPCQAWSMAGKRSGERDKALVYRALVDIEAGNDTRLRCRAQCEDRRSLLVVEPLRWTLALQPTWVALEQVPPVLELWQEYARILIRKGWRCWTGILSAERYGVPQTRRRAILMAHRDRCPAPPQATHQAYVPGEPARHEITLEGELLPWISMAEALGWDQGLAAQYRRGGERLEEEWSVDRPADVVTSRVNRWQVVDTGNTRSGSRPEGRERSGDAPAVAITSRADQLERRPRLAVEWVTERPATTVNGDPRISKPGHHDENESGSQQKDAVRVTEQEAAILQGFPPDYPFQGTRTKRFEQIGNAVPPPLARAVLSQLVDASEQERAA